MLDLVAMRTDLLSQIALAADEGHEDDGDFQIGAGPRRVARQDPETAAVGMHLGPERDLHGKIGEGGRAQKRPYGSSVDALHACLVFGAMNMAMVDLATAAKRKCGVTWVCSRIHSGRRGVRV